MGEIAHLRQGSGPPLVLLHGIGMRGSLWSDVAERLASHHDVVSVDLPGFGDSPVGDFTPSPAGFAERLEAFFDEIGVGRPDVAGVSLGGGTALELVRRRCVATATAFSPVGFQANRWEHGWAHSVLWLGKKAAGGEARGSERLQVLLAREPMRIVGSGHPWRLSPELILATSDSGRNAPGYMATLEQLRAWDLAYPDQLEGTPITVAWGTRDLLLLHRSQSTRARRMLPFAEHVDLPSCGHVPFYDDPDLCARVILARTGAG